MSTSGKNEYSPDYVVHPGSILDEILGSRQIKKSTFAHRCGLSLKTVSQIINGKAPVTPETALQFEKVLGIAAEIWTGLDSRYRIYIARLDEEKEHKQRIEWVTQFPLTELKKRDIITNPRDKTAAAEQLLLFFRVANVQSWENVYGKIIAKYRRSKAFSYSKHSTLAWLRIAELEADNIETNAYSRAKFIQSLKKFRGMTEKDPSYFEPKMKGLCSDAGVALIFIPELPRTRLCGATKWISGRKAILALTLRYKSNDQFWFSFFHEAGHIVLHEKKRVFIDHDKSAEGRLEREADSFAQNMLVPKERYDAFVDQGQFSKTTIAQFARKVNIAPGIIVGMLQHDRLINYSWHNDLKRRFELVDTD